MPSVNLTREQNFYHSSAKRHLLALKHEQAALREDITTGKRVNRPSDDASAFASARRMETLGRRHKQYRQSIATVKSWMNHTQDRLDHITDLFVTAYAKGLRAANAAGSDFDGDALVNQLKSLKDEVIDQLNAEIGDEYLFAGTNSLTQPFSSDGAVNAGDAHDIGDSRTVMIGPGRKLEYGVTGKDLYVYDTSSGDSIIDALDGLITAIQDGEDISSALGALQKARDHVIETGGEAGNTAARLSVADDVLSKMSVNLRARRADLEDTPMLEAITSMQALQHTLQAAYLVTSQTLQMSLVNFLR